MIISVYYVDITEEDCYLLYTDDFGRLIGQHHISTGYDSRLPYSGETSKVRFFAKGPAPEELIKEYERLV